ncbi:MAG: nucleotidyltransferase domain-containing protein [Nanoarchaeota archaeon]
MISNLFEQSLVKVLSLFLISPGSRYKRKEIQNKTLMYNSPLDNTLQKLNSLKLISEKKGLFSLNFEIEKNKEIFDIISKEYKYFNLPHNIFNILNQISHNLSKIDGIDSVLLFGSYAKLIYLEKSDIDIAIILKDKVKNIEKTKKGIMNLIKKISKNNEKDIQLHFFSFKDINENKSDPFIKDILINGKSLL